MQISVELRYAGVVIGRAEAVRAEDGTAGRLFLHTNDPMPVGTTLEMTSGTDVAIARVLRVVEVAGDKRAGMDVELLDATSLSAAEAAAAAAVRKAAQSAPARPQGEDGGASSLEAAVAAAAAAAGEAPAPTGAPEVADVSALESPVPIAVPEGVSEDISGISGRVTTEFGAVPDDGTSGEHTNGAGKRKRRRKR
jgi:hypothetical protein